MAAVDRDPQKVAAVLRDYEETLEVLTINSKPLINDLTMAADRYKPLGAEIIGKIESRLFEVPLNLKLPLLYLLDSIMKNLRGRYQDIINTKIVAIFCHCFEKLTEPKVRISLYKLRQTWNPFVVKKKLAAIDKHVHALDPNWPVTATDITAPVSPTIHVNPDFLLTGGERGGKMATSTAASSATATSTVTGTTASSSVEQTPPAKEGASAVSSTLEQRRKHVLEAQKRKKEQLRAKGSAESSDISTSTMTPNSAAAKDPRKVPAAAGTGLDIPHTSTVTGKTAVVSGKRNRASLGPRRKSSTRSSLSPDYDSRSATKRRKLSPARPRSASPSPRSASSRHQRSDRSHTESWRNRHRVTGGGERSRGGGGGEGGEGIGDILKTLDISSLMGSIQRVKKQTDTSSQDKVQMSMVQPPQLKPQDSVAPPTKGKGVVTEDDDVIPKIKSSHLDLDDIPVELLPTHQEKIMKQVERQLQSGRLSEEQHSTLVKQLDQLYALQRKKENGRGESRGSSPSGPATRGQSPPLTSDKGRTDHPLSDSVQSCHDNHLPSVSVPGTRPPPSVLDTDFRPPSPPPHAPVPHPHPPPDPHIDRHPHTRSHDRYPPRQFPDYHSGPRGPRPYRGRGPRGRHHFDRHPRPPGRPNSEWYPRGPPERWRDHNREESPPTSKIPLPQTQSNANESDPAQLFSKLVELGIIKEGEGEGKSEGRGEMGTTGPVGPPLPPPSDVPVPPIPFAIPTLTFTVATLKKPYSALVRLMYTGDPCATCGLRFRDRTTADYSRHLDWHFKMNSRDKTLQRPRHWFLHPEDWLKFEESTLDVEKRELLVLEREVEGMEEGGEGEGEREEGQETSCEVLPGEENEVCTICAEQFEQFWEEELEEWHFREALREDGKLYHTYCYQDAKESGALDASLQQQPSPVEADHKPLAIAN